MAYVHGCYYTPLWHKSEVLLRSDFAPDTQSPFFRMSINLLIYTHKKFVEKFGNFNGIPFAQTIQSRRPFTAVMITVEPPSQSDGSIFGDTGMGRLRPWWQICARLWDCPLKQTCSFQAFTYMTTVLYFIYHSPPLDNGDIMWYVMDAPPALSPKIVTELGSPPNAAMFCWIHRRAIVWSFKPMFPGQSFCSVLKKPRGPENVFIFIINMR